jgi:hypothetical protein
MSITHLIAEATSDYIDKIRDSLIKADATINAQYELIATLKADCLTLQKKVEELDGRLAIATEANTERG